MSVARRRAATLGPTPDPPVLNLPALNATLAPDGDVGPTNFDIHGDHLPT
jgi:hypothetical protein